MFVSEVPITAAAGFVPVGLPDAAWLNVESLVESEPRWEDESVIGVVAFVAKVEAPCEK